MLALRLSEGADLSDLPENQYRSILTRARKYQKAGMVQIQGARIHLTPEGFLVSNGILADLLLELWDQKFKWLQNGNKKTNVDENKRKINKNRELVR